MSVVVTCTTRGVARVERRGEVVTDTSARTAHSTQPLAREARSRASTKYRAASSGRHQLVPSPVERGPHPCLPPPARPCVLEAPRRPQWPRPVLTGSSRARNPSEKLDVSEREVERSHRSRCRLGQIACRHHRTEGRDAETAGDRTDAEHVVGSRTESTHDRSASRCRRRKRGDRGPAGSRARPRPLSRVGAPE